MSSCKPTPKPAEIDIFDTFILNFVNSYNIRHSQTTCTAFFVKRIYCLFLFIQSTRCDCFRHENIKNIPVRYFQLSSSKASTTPARKKRIKSWRDGHNKKISPPCYLFSKMYSVSYFFLTKFSQKLVRSSQILREPPCQICM